MRKFCVLTLLQFHGNTSSITAKLRLVSTQNLLANHSCSIMRYCHRFQYSTLFLQNPSADGRKKDSPIHLPRRAFTVCLSMSFCLNSCQQPDCCKYFLLTWQCGRCCEPWQKRGCHSAPSYERLPDHQRNPSSYYIHSLKLFTVLFVRIIS